MLANFTYFDEYSFSIFLNITKIKNAIFNKNILKWGFGVNTKMRIKGI